MITVPADTPVTSPDPFTVTFPLLALHVPPLAVSLNEIVEVPHTSVLPVIAVGIASTVTIAVAVPPPVV